MTHPLSVRGCWRHATAALALVAATLPAQATELLANGDFTLTTGPVINGGGAMVPANWQGMTTSVPNAGQMTLAGDGVFFFEVYSGSALPPAGARTNIYQTFTLAEACDCTLRFDYWLSNPNGAAPGVNGAQVAVDHWPTGPTDPLGPLFTQTFSADNRFNDWHRGVTLPVSLAAGSHTLYIGAIARPMINYNAGVVFYDNVSLSTPTVVPEPPSAALWAGGLAAVAWCARRRRPQEPVKSAPN